MFRFLCVLDFEATCDRDKKFTPPHEVIEFPSVMLELIDGQYQVVSEFQEFCKPIYNIKLTEFCKNLTGITQAQVSNGLDFPVALQHHWNWLSQFSRDPPEIMIITCGRWDIVEMMPEECRRWCITHIHPIYHRVINIKDVFVQRYGPFRGGMKQMLDYMELELLGRHHSGIADCRNIARMAQVLAAEISEDFVIVVGTQIYTIPKADRKRMEGALAKHQRTLHKINF